jgi:hypothetical protein
VGYVIVAVVLLLVIVPIFSVLPNARQRGQMAMRNAARSAGVSVELTSIADPNPDQDKYTSHIGKKIDPILKVAAYRVQRRRERDWRQLPQVNWCLQKDLGGHWHWTEPASEFMSDELCVWLDENINTLPNDVMQVDETSYNVTVYWHERVKGEEEKVFSFLKHCAGLPLHKPQNEE